MKATGGTIARLYGDIDRLQAELKAAYDKIERGKDQFVHLVAISCIADSAEIADAAREGIRILDQA